MQKKCVFAISEVKGMVEAHGAERPAEPLKDHFYFSSSELDGTNRPSPLTSIMLRI